MDDQWDYGHRDMILLADGDLIKKLSEWNQMQKMLKVGGLPNFPELETGSRAKGGWEPRPDIKEV